MGTLNTDKILATSILVYLSGFFLTVANADDESDKTKYQQASAHSAVVIDNKTQAASGLKTLVVTSVRQQAEYEVIGKVISIEPLMALRERYLVTKAELAGAEARLRQACQSLKRQQELFQNGVVAKRLMQDQEAQVLSDQAVVDVGRARLMKTANEARLLWGEKLSELALSEKANNLAGFFSGNEFLLQIILPTDKQLDSKIDTIVVEPNGNRSKAYPSALLSRSAQVDYAIPGESYFFKAKADNLRIGMKITAWIPEHSGTELGVTVPASALLWYMGQVYVYVKTGNDIFIRRMITSFTPVPEGYFISKGVHANEEIVTTGGQMLLSEELRNQIPDED